MISKTWWDYFQDDPFERVGRLVEDAFQQPIVIHMPRISWAYLDWLADVERCDIQQFIVDNDLARLPEDGSLHDWIEGAVKKGFLSREKKGLPRPAWLPPALPAEYVDI